MVYFFYFNKIILLNLIINIITMNSVNNNLKNINSKSNKINIDINNNNNVINTNVINNNNVINSNVINNNSSCLILLNQ